MNSTENFKPKWPEQTEVKKQEAKSDFSSEVIYWKKFQNLTKWSENKNLVKNQLWLWNWKEESKKLADIIHPKEWNEKSNLNKLEWIKTIDWKEFTTEKLKTLETRELLKMEASDRLNIVSAWDKKIDKSDIKKWFETTIDFSDNWKLTANIWVEDLFDKNVSIVLIDWKQYKRDSLTWAFKDEKWNRGVVLDWSNVKIEETRDVKDLEWLNEKTKEEYEKVLKSQKLDLKENKDELKIVREAVEKWLKEKEIWLILEGKFDELNDIEPISKKREILKNLIHLRDKWLLKDEVFIDKINLFDDARSIKLNEQLHSKKWDIKEWTPWYHKNKNGSMIADNPNIKWWKVSSSYGWNSYESSSSIWPNVDTGAIDGQIKWLTEVKNPEWSKKELIAKWVSEHNAEIIAKRIPKEWFEVAISFAKKEWKIKENKPIALASVSKKTWMISYPNWKAEVVKIITAQAWRTDMLWIVSHFDSAKIAWKWRDASKWGSTTVLWAAAYSPEWSANWWKWWHWVREWRIPGGKTWWCVWVKQDIAMRLAQSIQKNWGGYWYEVR